MGRLRYFGERYSLICMVTYSSESGHDVVNHAENI
nr:MAG TPA: hypothetical protein [Caudoviricetes sp.]